MYCKKCGKEIKDDSAFCPYCGEPVNATSQQTTQSQPRSNKSTQNRVRYNMPGANSVSWVTESFGGILFLVISILMTGYLVMYLFSGFGLTRFFLSVPRLLICIGCWMAYSSCHNGRLETTGFNLIGGGLIALLALYCIPSLILAIYIGMGNMISVIGIITVIALVLILAIAVGHHYNERIKAKGITPRTITSVAIPISYGVIGFASIGLGGFFCLYGVQEIRLDFIIDSITFICFVLVLFWLYPIQVCFIPQKAIRNEELRTTETAFSVLGAIFSICYFLTFYAIQFFALSSLKSGLQWVVSKLGNIPFIGDGVSSMLRDSFGQTVSGLLLIAVLACVVALLCSIRHKILANGEQN